MSKKMLGTMLLLGCCLSLSGCGESVQKSLEEAQVAYSSGNYQEVMQVLENYQEDPNAKALYRQAEIELLIKEATEAFEKEAYEEVVTLLEGAIGESEVAKDLYDEAKYDAFEVSIKNITRLSKDTQLADLLLDIEKTYEKDDNKRIALEDKVLDILEGYFEESPTLEDFEVWEGAAASLKKEVVGDSTTLAKSILKVLDNFAEEKLKRALEGTWIREDDTGLSGSYIDVSFKGDTGTGILTKVSENIYGFVKGDIKWKNMTILDDTNFVFDDLNRTSSSYYDYWSDAYVTDYAHDYEQGSGTLDFENETITIHITTGDYSDGVDQVWVREATKQKDTVKDKASEVVAANSNEYIFSNSDSQYLTDADLSTLTKDELRLARNEIFARHGYIFNDEGLRSHFAEKSWYTGTVKAEDFSNDVLNTVEKANVEKIKQYEQ